MLIISEEVSKQPNKEEVVFLLHNTDQMMIYDIYLQ